MPRKSYQPGRPLTREDALARCQRWLDRLDELIFESKDIDRNQLLAIKAGVDLVASYFRNAGWVLPDGATVNNDNRQVTVIMEKFSTPALELLATTMTDEERDAALEWLGERRKMLVTNP